ncbi:hypothetical protein FB451DRAFT_1441074 [Mycena latifolia]|nr:hypothetical protein FB451DRAFT_1441074 [Mycena latifolia]
MSRSPTRSSKLLALSASAAELHRLAYRARLRHPRARQPAAERVRRDHVLRPVPVSAPCTSVLSLAYGLHAAAAAPPRALLSRFPALITPSATYLRTPANGYAHAGAPTPFVHLVGPAAGFSA